ncbi:MAG TPA: aminoacyl--tRNA ligase-related protein [Candidatus Saccharimonadales bacterium]|nr:aminoacyl--tRNA ligase-related protein [Candidatus Saccharimonadales bacterium]
MRLTQLFTKTLRSAPSDEQALNAQLLIRAGFIYKEMAGVYAYLPLGIKVLENIKRIVREEMNAVGGQELIMTNLQRPDLWEKTDRWDDSKVDVWFKTKLQNDTELGLAWSHEEPITDMMRSYISSYRDLPANVYQFQTKLRNELRAKSGIMRGREFVMKDMYSYSLDEKQHQAFYDTVTEAYLKIFTRVGLGEQTFVTYSSGGAFTKFSHEFQTVTDAGEDVIYLDSDRKLAINKEVYTDEVIEHLGLDKSKLKEVKAAEVGNIFSFGTVKSEELDLSYTDKTGQKKFVVLGSYGIGITRLMGVIAEVFADDKGLVWPEAVAPYKVHLIRIGDKASTVTEADKLYNLLTEAGIEVIYDDRNLRVGESFADADLLGIPHRVVISDKTVANAKLEWKKRTEPEAKTISQAELLKILEG